MNEVIAKLVKMRESVDSAIQDVYFESFKTASEFLIYDDEFIPYNLLLQLENVEKILAKINNSYDKPIVITKYDKALSNFYKKYSLKRDINHIVDSIAYLTIQKEKPKVNLVVHDNTKIDDFYRIDILNKLASYHSQPYSAKEESLRQIGQSIGDYILTPTNYWLDKFNIDGFDKVPERYWQVAGIFKKRIWGKIQHKEHIDKKVFLCLGVNLENSTLFYGLECLRTGTSKLSTEQIFKFDHLTKGFPILEQIRFDQINEYNWGSLVEQSEKFLSQLIPLYDQVIDYIWNDTVDIKSVHNRLLPLTAKKPLSTNGSIETTKKIKSIAIDLVIAYEKSFLKYKAKNKLSKRVSKATHSNNHYDIASYHMDGTEKLIKVIASKSSSIQGVVISQSCIDTSIVNPEKTYTYIITDLGNKRKSGILHINKGRLDRLFSMKPDRYIVIS